MDTPKKNQIMAPISKVEDSPLFNFINNLSPIKPVKPLHITQTFNTFSFASLPSIFTSPHITSQKKSRIFSRRCLDFEMVEALRENLEDGSNSLASSLTQADENIFSSDTQTCIIPGFKDPLEKSLDLVTSKRDANAPENGGQLLQDASQTPGSLANEELNQNIPKKKRRRMENEGETEGCKHCNCKKSKCLKLYCECFAAGVYCIEPCSCQECFNKPIHEDTLLATRKRIESRNPLAFGPKVIRSSDSIPEYGNEPNKKRASSRHKIGCNCKKSSCLKKYCECYQGGVGCSIGCRCEGCKNAFGTRMVS